MEHENLSKSPSTSAKTQKSAISASNISIEV